MINYFQSQNLTNSLNNFAIWKVDETPVSYYIHKPICYCYRVIIMISEDALDPFFFFLNPKNPGYIMNYIFKHLPKLIVVSQNMSEKSKKWNM